jgi:uncharacterized Zn finger protein (UPF0148 family)
MKNDKRHLEESLATLLGFDLEDVSDVMDHLLTFESQEDLKDYLTDFMGDGQTKQVMAFVRNVMKFQRGEALDVPTTTTAAAAAAAAHEGSSDSVKIPLQESVKKASSDVPSKNTTKSANLTKKQRPTATVQKEAWKSSKPSKPLKSKEAHRKQKPKPKSASTVTPTTAGLEKATAKLSIDAPKFDPSPKQPQTKSIKPSPPPLPPIGKAKVICGCYGTINKALTNCLFCGRIICEKEGYGYCPHCGHLVQEVTLPANATQDDKKDWLHKERLLQFDRENAQRTVVIDEAADEYENSNSNWLTMEEQEEAEKRDDLKRADLHSLKKQTLNIAF